MKQHRAWSDVAEIERDLVQMLGTLRDALGPLEDGSEVDTALCSVETFCAVAIKVMQRTNPSKVRDCARTIEIKARMDGIPVVRGVIDA